MLDRDAPRGNFIHPAMKAECLSQIKPALSVAPPQEEVEPKIGALTARVDQLQEEATRLEKQLVATEAELLRVRFAQREGWRRVRDANTPRPPTAKERAIASKTRATEAARIKVTVTDPSIFLDTATQLKIPAERLDDFREMLISWLACELDYRSPERVPVTTPAEVARARNAAHSWLRAMKASRGLSNDPYNYDTQYHLQRFLNRYRSKKGRRSKEIECGRFLIFSNAVIQTILDLGGRLTLTPGREGKGHSGTLIKALTKLRPLFPSGFIPEELPVKHLQTRLRNARRALAVDGRYSKTRCGL